MKFNSWLKSDIAWDDFIIKIDFVVWVGACIEWDVGSSENHEGGGTTSKVSKDFD